MSGSSSRAPRRTSSCVCEMTNVTSASKNGWPGAAQLGLRECGLRLAAPGAGRDLLVERQALVGGRDTTRRALDAAGCDERRRRAVHADRPRVEPPLRVTAGEGHGVEEEALEVARRQAALLRALRAVALGLPVEVVLGEGVLEQLVGTGEAAGRAPRRRTCSAACLLGELAGEHATRSARAAGSRRRWRRSRRTRLSPIAAPIASIFLSSVLST